MSPSFIDALLLDCVAYGFSGGPEWVTLVVPLRGGREKRAAVRSRPKHYYVAPYLNRDQEHRDTVVAAFNTCMGRGHTFRFFDRQDFQLDNQVIGTGDGSSEQTLQLVKTYAFGNQSAERIITKPVDFTVDYGRGERTLGAAPAFSLTADGSPFSDWEIDYTTGIVTLTAGAGDVIRATGWFDVPVRFNHDKLMFSRTDLDAHSSDVELIEVWDEEELE